MKIPHRTTPLVACALALALSATPAFAQKLTVKEEKAGQLAKATVKPEAALATAQAAVPKGKLASAEIEEEDGALVYVFSFKTVGKSGEDEVLVDARTGKLVKTEHESPADEAREKAKDSTKGKKPAKPSPGA